MNLRNWLLLLLLGCTRADPMPPERDRVSSGTWGGEDAGMIVESNVAHVHVKCTNGYFAAPIVLDANHRFTAGGSYVVRAYPVQTGPELPAQISGIVEGNRMTFSVAVNDTVEKQVVSLGPVTVFYERHPKMQNCPICTRDRSWKMNLGRGYSSADRFLQPDVYFVQQFIGLVSEIHDHQPHE